MRGTLIKAQNQGSTKTPKEKQLALLKLLNRAIQSDAVVDLFDLLEQDYPHIDLLSEDFLGIVKERDSPDLWASTLEGYLKSEIKDKASRHLATKKRFEEKLKQAMNQYHNHNLTVMEIINELMKWPKRYKRN